MEWEQRIRRARKKKAFRGEDVDLAENWGSCAVGEGLSARLGDSITGATVHNYPALDREGMKFYEAVVNNQVTIAWRLFNSINRRIAAIFD